MLVATATATLLAPAAWAQKDIALLKVSYDPTREAEASPHSVLASAASI